MPESNNNDFFVDLAKDVAVRFVIHEESAQQIRSLYIQAAKSINWPAVMNSETVADEVLNRLELQGVNSTLILNLTGNFMYRTGLTTADARYALADKLAAAVTWPRDAKELRNMIPRLTASLENARNAFVGCPWMMFLYLLSMTNVLSVLDAAEHAKHAPKPS